MAEIRFVAGMATSRFRGDHLAGDGQVGEGVSPALDASCILNRIVCSSNQTSSICEVKTSTWDNPETP